MRQRPSTWPMTWKDWLSISLITLLFLILTTLTHKQPPLAFGSTNYIITLVVVSAVSPLLYLIWKACAPITLIRILPSWKTSVFLLASISLTSWFLPAITKTLGAGPELVWLSEELPLLLATLLTLFAAFLVHIISTLIKILAQKLPNNEEKKERPYPETPCSQVFELQNYNPRHAPEHSRYKNDLSFVGRGDAIGRLVNTLRSTRNSRGCYLVSGYRGTGKTSVVNRAISEYKGTEHNFWKDFANLLQPSAP